MLWRELRQLGSAGGYPILTGWLQPQREAARVEAVRRFKTPPGEHAQVDCGRVGDVEIDGQVPKLWVFHLHVGLQPDHDGRGGAGSQKPGTLLRLHEEAFRQLGGVPREVLYDPMKTVWQGADKRGEIVWNPVFLDFARYWGFTLRLCRPVVSLQLSPAVPESPLAGTPAAAM